MTNVVINTMLVYDFVYPDLGFEISFEKEGQQDKGALILK